MLKQLKKNEKGVVFVTVLMIIIVMMVLAISVVSLNVSQVNLTELEIQRVRGEIIAMGALAKTFANQMSNAPGNVIEYSVTIGNFTYEILSNVYGPEGNLDITVTLQ